MNIESVKSLFSLFSGEDDIEGLLPLITLSVSEVESMLVSEEAAQDIRTEFLCAALANYRLVQIKCARDRTADTYAGKLVSSPKDSGTLKYAQKLLSDYIGLCRGLIKSETFIFMSACSETEDIINA